MAAISAALHSTLAAGTRCSCPQQLYGTTYQLAESQLRPRGVEIVYLDVTDVAAWDRPARVRYVETMANPGFPLADLAALAATKGDGLLDRRQHVRLAGARAARSSSAPTSSASRRRSTSTATTT